MSKKNKKPSTAVDKALMEAATALIEDSQKGFVGFYVSGKDSQVHVDMDYFIHATCNLRAENILAFRHIALAALNMLLGIQKQEPLTVDDPLLVFITVPVSSLPSSPSAPVPAASPAVSLSSSPSAGATAPSAASPSPSAPVHGDSSPCHSPSNSSQGRGEVIAVLQYTFWGDAHVHVDRLDVADSLS